MSTTYKIRTLLQETADDFPSTDFCVIYALAGLANVSEDTVWKVAKPFFNLRRTKGIISGHIPRIAAQLGLEYVKTRWDLLKGSGTPIEFRNQTLRQVLEHIRRVSPKGMFVISVPKHALSYRQGVVYDTYPKMRAIVSDVMEFKRAT